VKKFGRLDIFFPSISFRPNNLSAERLFGRTIVRPKKIVRPKVGLYNFHTSIVIVSKFVCLWALLAPKWPKSRAENAEGAVDTENAEDAEVVGAVEAEDAEEFRGKFRFSDPTFFDLVIVLVNSNIFFVLVIVFGNEL
jgi:hypothetical protein